jgi:hypothetical protein
MAQDTSLPGDPFSNPRLQTALSYADLGWRVFPHIFRTPNRRTRNGQTFSSRAGTHRRTPPGVAAPTTDAATISQWWQEWPDADIAIATGRASDLVVLEIELAQESAGPVWYMIDAQRKASPTTIVAVLGASRDFVYYRHPGFRVPPRVSLVPGLTVHGDHGAVIAPPSLHGTAHDHRWYPSAHPATMPLAPVPKGLGTLLIFVSDE